MKKLKSTCKEGVYLMNKGYITFNRKGIIEEDCIELQLKDEKSKNRFMEVHIPLDEFMRALTGVSERPMEYEVNYKESIHMHLDKKSLYLQMIV